MTRVRAAVLVLTAIGLACGASDGGEGQAVPDAPAVDAPMADAPIADGPVVDAPITDGPLPDASVTDGPMFDGPTDDGPAPDAPDVDAPVIDAPTPDAPITDASITDAPAPPSDGPPLDSPNAEITLSVLGTGAGVIEADPLDEWCANTDCATFHTRQTQRTYTFRQWPIAGSTFTGWSGCTPQADGSCTVFLQQDTLVTATYEAPPGVTWVRSAWPLHIATNPVFLSATVDGVMAAGCGYGYANRQPDGRPLVPLRGATAPVAPGATRASPAGPPVLQPALSWRHRR